MKSPFLIAGAGFLLLVNGPGHRHEPAYAAASKCERFSENPLPFPDLTPACRPPSRLRPPKLELAKGFEPPTL
jgi:hypothetical protein